MRVIAVWPGERVGITARKQAVSREREVIPPWSVWVGVRRWVPVVKVRVAWPVVEDERRERPMWRWIGQRELWR